MKKHTYVEYNGILALSSDYTHGKACYGTEEVGRELNRREQEEGASRIKEEEENLMF